ncbi:MAG TPA: hypothetical protein VNA87_01440 [Actinomycetota bacterium]|nr:hypothetical protein [Actinomycetota bacterium]
MRRLAVAMITLLTLAGIFAIQPASAGVSGTDPSGDVIDRALQYTMAFKKDTVAQNSPLDITGWSFDAASGRINASITTAQAWPTEGSLPTALPPGVTTLEARWVWRSNLQDIATIVGQSCSDKASKYETPAGDFTPVVFDTHFCNDFREGPFPASDGWSFQATVTLKNVQGKLHYNWLIGWVEEYTQIIWLLDGESEHDPVVAPADKGIITNDTANKKISLSVPYLVRSDAADDKDGLADETRTHTFMRPGDAVTQVTAALYSTAETSQPDPPLCPAKPGTPTEPVAKELPAPLNDPNECYSQGAGLTTLFDWAPGDPFTPGGPTWGGFKPRDFPRAISYAPGAGTATCNYPAGLGAGLGIAGAVNGTYVPGSVDTRGPVTLANGATVYPPAGGGSFHVFGAGATGLRVGLPTGQERACGHIPLSIGFHFLDATGDFNAT